MNAPPNTASMTNNPTDTTTGGSDADHLARWRDAPTRYDFVALSLVEKGWSPVPLHPGSKVPARREWQRRALMSDAELRREVERELLWRGDADRRGDACGVVVPESIVVIDNDLMDRPSNDVIWQIMCAELGFPPMVRVGASPRSLSVYGVAQPVASRRLGGIDVFCGSGQFAAFGVHAKTGRPYAWSDSNPLNARPERLARVYADAVERFIGRVVATGVLTRVGLVQSRRINSVSVNNALGPVGSADSRVPYLATVRLNQLFDRHDGLVKPAVRELIAEIGAEAHGRHDCIVAVCGRLVQIGWGDDAVSAFVTPLVDAAFGDGSWLGEVEAAVRHARGRQAGRSQAGGTAGSARVALIMSGFAGDTP